MKRRVRFFRLGLYVLLMIIVALTSTAITMRLVIHGAEVAVPDLANMTLGEARQRAQTIHLSTEVDGRYYSNDVASGHVLTQLPTAGTVVRRGWRVRISESLGPRRVSIPDVVGQPERISSIRIRRLGLELGSVAHLPFRSEEADVVLAQNPPANSSDVSRPRVSILVADPPVDSQPAYVMPDFVGEPLQIAEDEISRAGLELAPQAPKSAPAPASGAAAPAVVGSAAAVAGPVAAGAGPSAANPTENLWPPAGTITAQYPPAGGRVDAQMLIRLTVSQ